MKWFLTPLLFFSLSLAAAPFDFSLNADKALLMNGKTGAILFEKEAFTPAYPASTTKIATTLYALEIKGDALDKPLTVKSEAIASITPQAKRDSKYRSPPYWIETDSTHIGLKKGEELPLRHLLYAVMVKSANDAANVVAMGVSGTVPQFMEEVNAYLTSIGCTQTRYNNPSGLHHPAHTTTAYDLALMIQTGLNSKVFRELIGTERFACPETNLEYERIFKQTNLLLRQGAYNYPRAIGGKTGVTQAAGNNLVAAAEEGGRQLIGVVLGCKSRAEVYQDMLNMFEAAFNETKMRRTFLPKGDTSLTRKIKGAQGKLKTILPNGLHYDYYPSEDEPIKAEVRWITQRLPIRKGAQVGAVCLINEREMVIKESPIIAARDLRRAYWPWLTIAAIALLTFWVVRRA